MGAGAASILAAMDWSAGPLIVGGLAQKPFGVRPLRPSRGLPADVRLPKARLRSFRYRLIHGPRCTGVNLHGPSHKSHGVGRDPSAGSNAQVAPARGGQAEELEQPVPIPRLVMSSASSYVQG